MAEQYDVIIVGARVAGASTALLLARQGYRVLLVDRARFPSDMMSGHFIQPPGVALLRRWGLLERLVALGAPAVTHLSFDVGPFALRGSPPPAEGVVAGYAPRRYLFDTMLVEEAIAAGAELREGFAVRELVWEDGRVAGVRGSVRAGPLLEARAPLVVGADGVRSLVARAVQAPAYQVQPTLSCAYYSYWSGVAIDGGELYARDGQFIVAMPTNNGLVYVGVQWPMAAFQRVRLDVEGSFHRALATEVPALAERLQAGQREERFVGTGEMPNYLRQPYGPGWALAGDAGYHRDPITAQGMTDSLRDADLLSTAIHRGFSGAQPLEQALAAYEQERNQAVLPMYAFTCDLAALRPPPPELHALFGALRGNQAEIDRFLGLVAGTTPFHEFLAPTNVARIIREADERMLVHANLSRVPEAAPA